MCNRLVTRIVLSILGLTLVIIGWVALPIIVKNKIADTVALKKNSESWERWEKIPIPIYFRIYLFNVNNPDEILEGKAPNVTEKGPYSFREYRIKEIISSDEDTVTYRQKIIFEFDKEGSNGLSEEDEVVLPNAPAFLFAYILDRIKGLDEVINLFDGVVNKLWPPQNDKDKNSFFKKVKVKDILFKGLPIYCNQTVSVENLDSRILCHAFRLISPKTTIPDDLGQDVHSFALLKYKNNSYDGIYKINPGIKDITKIGQVESWNGVTKLTHWKGESCNRILGTDGTLFRPFLEEDDVNSVHIYHTDVCRSLKLTYAGNSDFKGIVGRRYIADKNLFASVLENKDNYCYCPQSIKGLTHYAGCTKSGLLELTSCHSAPVLVTYPHFLMADEDFQNKVIGLQPDVEKHLTFVDLEPNTGYPMRARSRIQINIFLKDIPEVRSMKKLPNVLLPVLSVEEAVELDDNLINIMNSQLFNVLTIVKIVRWLMIGIGICLIMGFLYLLFI